MKQRYVLTDEDYKALLRCSEPSRHSAPRTPQQRANIVWETIGKRVGFDYTTVEPSHEGDKVFYAVPTVIGDAVTRDKHVSHDWEDEDTYYNSDTDHNSDTDQEHTYD